MTHPSDIYHLRNANLDPKLALQLSPFINSWRPHDPIPERELLGERLPLESPCSMSNLAKDIGKSYVPKKKRQA